MLAILEIFGLILHFGFFMVTIFFIGLILIAIIIFILDAFEVIIDIVSDGLREFFKYIGSKVFKK